MEEWTGDHNSCYHRRNTWCTNTNNYALILGASNVLADGFSMGIPGIPTYQCTRQDK